MGKKKTATAVSKLEGTALSRVRFVLGVTFLLDVAFSVGLLLSYKCGLISLWSFTDCGGMEVIVSLLRCFIVGVILYVCNRFGAPPLFEWQNELDEETEEVGMLMRAREPKIDRSLIWRRGCMMILFMVLTITQVALGIKGTVSVLDPAVVNREAIQAFLCLLIICCNVELFVSKRLIETSTTEDGVYSKLSHGHRLYAKGDVGRSKCDRCHLRVVDPRCYNCASCNFDVCLACLRSGLRKEQRMEEEQDNEKRGRRLHGHELNLSTSGYVKHVLLLARPHAILIALALFCVLVKNAASIMVPNYTGQILDSIIRGNVGDFKTALIYFISINVVMGFVAGASKLLFNAVFQRFDRGLKTLLFRRILSQDIEFFDNSSTGDLLVKLQDDTRMMLSPIQYYLASVLGFILSLIGGFIMCVRTSFRLSILAFTILGPLSMIVYAYSSWASVLNSSMRGLTSSMSDTAKESFSLIRTIRTFGRERVQEQQYNDFVSDRLNMGVKDAFAAAGAESLSSYLELALHALVLVYGGFSILSARNELTIGGLITFQLYWAMLSSAFQGLMDQLSQFSKASGAAQRVIELLERLPEIDPDAGIPITEPLGDIELHDVWFSYKARPENMVLKGVSLKLPRGSVCALVGRSGGGKSTIVSLLCGNYKPLRGYICVGGVDLTELRLSDYRQRIGVVQQDTELFNDSIEQNIVFGSSEGCSQEDMVEAAQRANCLDFIEGFEDGFATKVGERGVKMSGGQRQRIAIARIFIRKLANFLLMDEATSALDSESEAMVQSSIDKLMKDQTKPTVLLVAHRLSTVVNADIIAVVEGGRIVEQGAHAELLQLRGIYSKLVEKQVRKMANSIGEHNGKGPLDQIDSLFEEVHDKGKDIA
jgi:ABC-type multidrug transport system fused ATPase/permease subunit